MKNIFKKCVVPVVTIASLAVCSTGISANAANIEWTNYTSGNVTTRTATTTERMTYVGTALSNISAFLSHQVNANNLNSWSVFSYNLAGSSRHMYAHTYARNSADLTIDWSTYNSESEDVNSGSTIYCNSSSTYSNLPTAYTLCYNAQICTSTSTNSPVVQEIELFEMLTK